MDQLLLEFAVDPSYCAFCKSTRRTNPKCLFRNHAEDIRQSEKPAIFPLAPVFLAKDPIMIAVQDGSGLLLTDANTGSCIKISNAGSLQLAIWIQHNLK